MGLFGLKGVPKRSATKRLDQTKRRFLIRSLLVPPVFIVAGYACATTVYIEERIGHEKQPGEYELILVNDGSKWTIADSRSMSEQNAERLFVTENRRVRLGASVPAPSQSRRQSSGNNSDPKSGYWRCYSDNSDREKVGYSICNSSFTFDRTPLLAVALETLLISGSGRSVDKDKIRQAIDDIDIVSWLKQKVAEAKNEAALNKYKTAFSNAKTSSAYAAFIQEYASNDPENLVPQAITRRDELRTKEADDLKRYELEEAARREAQAKAQEEQRKYEQAQRRQRIAQVEAFRRTISVEMETNCGPVLEVKGKLVKVYAPVRDYGNEHWIRREVVFPAGYDCSFINGSYRPPSL